MSIGTLSIVTTEGADWFVTTSHFNLLEKLYFVDCSGPVILIANKGQFILLQFIDCVLCTLFFIFRGLDCFVCHVRICRFLILLDCYLRLRSSAPAVERSLLSKRRICVISDDGKRPNTHQWYLSYDTASKRSCCRTGLLSVRMLPVTFCSVPWFNTVDKSVMDEL
jgi:hypothetical protein